MTENKAQLARSPNSPGVAVLLPAWNEGENLPALAAAILRFPEVSELIVIDDASSDGTEALWRASHASADSRCVFVRNSARLGLACSVLQALRLSKSELVLVRDSDWNHDLATMPLLLRAVVHGADLAVASRYEQGERKVGRTNDLLSIALNLILRHVFPGISDATYGYFLLRRELLDGLPVGWIFRGRGEYSLRLYRWLRKHRPALKVTCVPTTVQPRGGGHSSTRSLQHGFAYLECLAESVPEPSESGADLSAALRSWKRRGEGVAACGHSGPGFRSRLALLGKVRAFVRGEILDLGCGNGAFFEAAFPGFGKMADGVDLSPELLESGRKVYRGVTPGDLRRGVPAALAAKKYDTLLCLEVAQYFSWFELLSLFTSAKASAAPGASLLCLFPHRASLWHRIRHGLGLGKEDYLSHHDASLLVAGALEAGWRLGEAYGCSYGSEAPQPVEAFQKASLTQAHFLVRFQA